MTVTSAPAAARETWENSPQRLLTQSWVLTVRVLRRWRRDPATVLESLIMPVTLLITLNIVLGDGIRQLTGHSALYNSAPLIAMVGAMSGSMLGGIGLMAERDGGLLARLWVLPMHRASGLLSRLAADAVRIVVTTLIVLCAAMIMGFRFRQGIPAAVAWVLVPMVFGIVFTAMVLTLALYSANTIMVEGTEVVWGLLMFFSIGFVPLDQYPRWLQPVVEHQPVSYAIKAMRGLSLDGPVLQPLLGLSTWSVCLAAVCAVPLALGYRKASTRE